MRIANICGVLILLVSGVAVARAQAPLPLRPGERIRVTAPSVLTPAQQAGRFLAQRSDSLILQPDDGSSVVVIPRSAIADIEVSLGRHSATGRGSAIGALTGAATGAALGAALWHKGSCTVHPGVLFLPGYTSDCVS